jgi:hypothetical protein
VAGIFAGGKGQQALKDDNLTARVNAACMGIKGMKKNAFREYYCADLIPRRCNDVTTNVREMSL